MWIKFDTQDLKRHDIEVLRSLLTEAEKGLDEGRIMPSDIFISITPGVLKNGPQVFSLNQEGRVHMRGIEDYLEDVIAPVDTALEINRSKEPSPGEDRLELVAMDPSIRFREPEESVAVELPIPIYPVWLPAESAPKWIDPVDLDAQGIPWCADIHSRTKAKTKKGVWRSKRSQPTTQEFKVPEEPSPTWELADPTIDTNRVEGGMESGTWETGTCTVSLPEPPLTFEELTKQITSMISAGQIGTVEVMNVIQETGLNFLPDLQTRPELIPVVNDKLLRLTEMSE